MSNGLNYYSLYLRLSKNAIKSSLISNLSSTGEANIAKPLSIDKAYSIC